VSHHPLLTYNAATKAIGVYLYNNVAASANSILLTAQSATEKILIHNTTGKT
jgi:hypothetical protein